MANQYDEFQAAYKAWRDAADSYEEQIVKVLADPDSFGQLKPIIDDLELLRLQFMELSKPFIS